MKIYIWNNGDASVGIPGDSATVEMEIDPDYLNEGGRDEIRSHLRMAFDNIFGSGFRNTVMFEDELEV